MAPTLLIQDMKTDRNQLQTRWVLLWLYLTQTLYNTASLNLLNVFTLSHHLKLNIRAPWNLSSGFICTCEHVGMLFKCLCEYVACVTGFLLKRPHSFNLVELSAQNRPHFFWYGFRFHVDPRSGELKLWLSSYGWFIIKSDTGLLD